jgi:hypothetical protein
MPFTFLLYLQNEPKILHFQLKNKDSQKNEPKYVAQTPSAVVIHPGPKGRPYSGSWLLASGSRLLAPSKNKTNPNMSFSIENRTSKIYPQGIENHKTNPNPTFSCSWIPVFLSFVQNKANLNMSLIFIEA